MATKSEVVKVPTNHIQKQQRDHAEARVRRAKERADRRKARVVAKRIERSRQPKKEEPKGKDPAKIAARKMARIVWEERRKQAHNEQLVLLVCLLEGVMVAQIERDRLAEEEKAAEVQRLRLEAEAFRAQQAEKARQYYIQQLIQRLTDFKSTLAVTYDPLTAEIVVVDPSFAKKTPAWRKLEERVAAVSGEFKSSYPQIGVGVRLSLSK